MKLKSSMTAGFVLLILAGGGAGLLSIARDKFYNPTPTVDTASGDPWTAKQVVQPGELAQEIKSDTKSKPLVVCVGFEFLYQSAHPPGAVLYGPGREPGGLKALEQAAQNWPRNRDIVVYCGCCPMKQCPNLRPAVQTLSGMGFTHLRVLNLDHDFRQDWLKKRLPVEKGSGQ